MNIRTQMARVAFAISMTVVLVAVPTTPTFAGSLHTSLALTPLLPTLTMSAPSSVHVGLLKVKFAAIRRPHTRW